jgi:hypothetical protein
MVALLISTGSSFYLGKSLKMVRLSPVDRLSINIVTYSRKQYFARPFECLHVHTRILTSNLMDVYAAERSQVVYDI